MKLHKEQYLQWLQHKKGILQQNLNTAFENKDLVQEFITLQEYVKDQLHKLNKNEVTSENAAIVVASPEHGFDFKLNSTLGLYQHLLHYVALQGSQLNLQVIENIVNSYAKSGQNLNATDEKNQTPLMYAMNKSNLNMFTTLAKNGVDIFSPNINGFTPLHCICKYITEGNMDKSFFVNWIEAGYRTDVTDRFGCTVKQHLERRVEKSESLIAKELLKLLPEETGENNSNETNNQQLDQFTEKTKEALKEYYKITVNKDCIQQLENNKVDLTSKDHDMLLHFLSTSSKQNKSITQETIEELIKAGMKTSFVDMNGFTALHFEVLLQQHDTVLLLAKCGIGTSQDKLDAGCGIINYAVQYGDVVLIEKLGQLKNLANEQIVDFNIVGANGGTAIGPALFGNNEEMLKVLIKYGANINFQTQENGETFMDHLCAGGKIESIKLAIKYGAKVDLSTKNGEVPLCHVLNGNYSRELKLELIDLLCQNGASKTITIKDNQGNSPLKIASTVLKDLEITKKLSGYYNLEQTQKQFENFTIQENPLNIFETQKTDNKVKLSGDDDEIDN